MCRYRLTSQGSSAAGVRESDAEVLPYPCTPQQFHRFVVGRPGLLCLRFFPFSF